MPVLLRKDLQVGSALPAGAPSTDAMIGRLLKLSEAMSEISFYPYQAQYAWAILSSLLLVHSDKITALFGRQSGKSKATSSIGATLALALPWLAQEFPNDWRFNWHDEQGRYHGYKKGISVGIYAPKKEQAQMTLEKLNEQMETETSQAIMEEMGVAWSIANGTTLGLSNGSVVKAVSASPQAHIEGSTHHLLILEEAQDLDTLVVRKSLMPMLAATGGTCVRVGTASFGRSDFYEAIRSNIRNDANAEDASRKSHFFFPAEVAARYNSAYKMFVEKEAEDLGSDSDAFRTAYKCEFILERGMFLSERLLYDTEIAQQFGKFSKVYKGLSEVPESNFDLVAGVDFAKKHDSTVATILAVDWKNPVIDQWLERPDGTDLHYLAYVRHVVAWKQWSETDYEIQFHELKEFLERWSRLRRVVVDSTSLGDVIHDRLVATMGDTVEVLGMTFTLQSKSDGYKYLSSEFSAKRLTYPKGVEARKTREYKQFTSQMLDLEKDYTPQGVMKVAAPSARDAHDDYPDSLMLAVYGSAEPQNMDTEVVDESQFYFLRSA